MTVTTEPPSTDTDALCSVLARREGADPAGTAAEFDEFLLVEHLRPWTRSAAEDAVATTFPAAEAARISTRTGLRPHAVRPVHGRRDTDGRRLLYGVVGPRLTMTELAQPVLDGPGRQADGPLFAVCTNGKRDRCCAQFGRQLAVALHAEFGEKVMEISHLGGHRFAATMLVLPWGYAYGYLDLPRARQVLRAAAQGLVEPTGLRGRADLSPAAQAAEVHWRRQLGPAAPDAVSAVRSEPAGEEILVTATVTGRAERLRLTQRTGPQIHDTACGGKPFTADRWEVRC